MSGSVLVNQVFFSLDDADGNANVPKHKNLHFRYVFAELTLPTYQK